MAAVSGSTTSGSLTGALRSTTGGTIEQSDGTAWIDMYRVRMLAIALWLACHDRAPMRASARSFLSTSCTSLLVAKLLQQSRNSGSPRASVGGTRRLLASGLKSWRSAD